MGQSTYAKVAMNMASSSIIAAQNVRKTIGLITSRYVATQFMSLISSRRAPAADSKAPAAEPNEPLVPSTVVPQVAAFGSSIL